MRWTRPQFPTHSSFIRHLTCIYSPHTQHLPPVHGSQKRTSGSLQLPCVCWELNPGPLQEQQELLSTEPFLQPFWFVFVGFACVVFVFAVLGSMCSTTELPPWSPHSFLYFVVCLLVFVRQGLAWNLVSLTLPTGILSPGVTGTAPGLAFLQ